MSEAPATQAPPAPQPEETESTTEYEDWLKCPFCKRQIGAGLEVMIEANMKARAYMICACGLTSRKFSDKIRLKQWWHTRDGVAPPEPKIVVTPAQNVISGNPF